MIRDRMSLPPEVRARLDMTEDDLVTFGYATRSRGLLVEARRSVTRIETRDADGVTPVGGYAATFDVDYDVAGGAPFGWAEVFDAAAFNKTLSDGADVRFLVNHEGLPLARTKSGTMTLTPDEVGLRVDVPALDMSNPTAVELVSALARGDVDQMSHAFRTVRQEWSPDYMERRILEVELFDVSAVTYPANDVTVLALRSSVPSVGIPLSLALAQMAALTQV